MTPRLYPYYDYLGESGVPLALHTGLGPPGAPHSFAPKFRAHPRSPDTLRTCDRQSSQTKDIPDARRVALP